MGSRSPGPKFGNVVAVSGTQIHIDISYYYVTTAGRWPRPVMSGLRTVDSATGVLNPAVREAGGRGRRRSDGEARMHAIVIRAADVGLIPYVNIKYIKYIYHII